MITERCRCCSRREIRNAELLINRPRELRPAFSIALLRVEPLQFFERVAGLSFDARDVRSCDRCAACERVAHVRHLFQRSGDLGFDRNSVLGEGIRRERRAVQFLALERLGLRPPLVESDTCSQKRSARVAPGSSSLWLWMIRSKVGPPTIRSSETQFANELLLTFATLRQMWDEQRRLIVS